MVYFCFIQSENGALTHMEPLDAVCPREAESRAAALLDEHRSGMAAHVYSDEALLLTICSRARDLSAVQ